ncbi:MAG: hypothetical protein P9E24_11860 [Candidatus Competibacter sp.]|nr:hypothetical protein [Candidatus Competibacter sp.]MDG4583243.1 hypothetical protein [Candidatus Competibacter sp.]
MPVHSRFALALLVGMAPAAVVPAPTEILLKQGSCPSGYHTQDHYCVANRNHPPAAVPKNGPCPSGYHTQGHYCVANRR